MSAIEWWLASPSHRPFIRQWSKLGAPKHSTVPDYGHFHKYLKIDQNQHCLNQSDHSIVDVSNRWYPINNY